jgi:hypothetical protein
MFMFSSYWLPLLSINYLFIIAITLPAYAQSTLPLEEDQDGDGNPLSEEADLAVNCRVDFSSTYGMRQLSESLGVEYEPTISEDDCNFAMHYLSGQCEDLMAKGVNVTEVCTLALSDYLEEHDLFTKDFPIDTGRFSAILDEYYQNEASKEQEKAQEEANKPSWAEDLE